MDIIEITFSCFCVILGIDWQAMVHSTVICFICICFIRRFNIILFYHEHLLFRDAEINK